MSNSKLDLELLTESVNNKSSPANTSSVCEHVIINMNETRDAIRESLDLRAQHVALKSVDIVSYNLHEMEDAPDQQIYGLTREQVARLLAAYEARIEGEAYGNFAYERSIDGALRVNKYQPDPVSDFSPSAPTINVTQDNPGGQEPWEYDVYNVPHDYQEPNSDETDEVDVSGIDNQMQKEEADVVNSGDSSDLLAAVVDRAITMGHDIKVELGDGNCLYLDPHTLVNLKNSGLIPHMHEIIGDIHTFASALGAGYADEDDGDSE